jgi:hypothetical protein
MILPRWPPVYVRPLYTPFLETEASLWPIIFSGPFSIDSQRAEDSTRNLTAVHSVRPDSGSVWRICEVEWRYRTWYVQRRMQLAFKSYS